jgi:hypothetical protein
VSKRDDQLIYEKYKIITEGVSIAEMGSGAKYTDAGGKHFTVVISNDALATLDPTQQFKTTSGAMMAAPAIKTGGGFVGMNSSDSSVIAQLPTDFANLTLTTSTPASTSKAARGADEYDRFLGWKTDDPDYPEGRPARADEVGLIRRAAQTGAETLANAAVATKGARDKVTPWLAKKLTTGTRKKGSGTASAATGYGP